MYAIAFLATFFLAGLSAAPWSAAEGGLDLGAEPHHPDAVVPTRGDAVVAWSGLDRASPRKRNVCYLTRVPTHRGTDEHVGQGARHELFAAVGEIGTCCVGRMALAPTGAGRSLAVTACSGQSGTWLWSQVVSPSGAPLEVSAPVLPIPGRSQEVPQLVAAGGGRSWLSWVEREGSSEAGGVVRTILVDATGEPVLEALDVSSRSLAEALGGPAADSLHSAPLPGGGVAIAWLARSGDGALQIRFRLLGADGVPTTPEVVAIPDDHAPKGSYRIHGETDGGVTLLWTRSGPDGKPDRVFGRTFSGAGEAVSVALPIAVDGPKRTQIHPRLVRAGTSDWVIWSEWVGRSAEGSIAARRWSPEACPVGLTTRFPATFAPDWPLLEAVPDGAGGAFTLFWHADPNGFADPGRLAWRRVVVPDAR